MIAATLGGLVFALALVAVWPRRGQVVALVAAALAATTGVVLYIRGWPGASAALSLLAIALPIGCALRLARPAPWRVAVVAFAVVIFQAMLGMWTVTLLLKPIVVMGHLLGGLLTFALLGYVALRLANTRRADARTARRCKPLLIGALALLALQIALGGWTSANYAALACGADFPKCAGAWWPPTDFREGFVLWRGIGVNYEGGVLDRPRARRSSSRIAIGALARLRLCTASSRRWPGDAACVRWARSPRCCCARKSRSASATSACACRCRSRPRIMAWPRCCC